MKYHDEPVPALFYNQLPVKCHTKGLDVRFADAPTQVRMAIFVKELVPSSCGDESLTETVLRVNRAVRTDAVIGSFCRDASSEFEGGLGGNEMV